MEPVGILCPTLLVDLFFYQENLSLITSKVDLLLPHCLLSSSPPQLFILLCFCP